MERGEGREAACVPSGRGGTILLVEDDPDAREASTAVLEHLGYRVVSAATSAEAVDRWDAHRSEIVLVVSDLMAKGPDGSAPEAWRLLQARGATVPIVVLSGYALTWERPGPEEGVAAWLQKPVGIDELGATLARALAAAR